MIYQLTLEFQTINHSSFTALCLKIIFQMRYECQYLTLDFNDNEFSLFLFSALSWFFVNAQAYIGITYIHNIFMNACHKCNRFVLITCSKASHMLMIFSFSNNLNQIERSKYFCNQKSKTLRSCKLIDFFRNHSRCQLDRPSLVKPFST